MTIAKIAAKIRVAVMVKPNDFSSSFNTLMVVRLAFRELGQLLLRLQARRCGHGSAVRVSWVHINPISARINAGKLAGHAPSLRFFAQRCRYNFYFGSLSARIPSLWISGGLANRSPVLAFSINAAATLPLRCASRPVSSSNVSKMANEDGPS